MRREARIRTCRSENFFSSSRVRLEGSVGLFAEVRGQNFGELSIGRRAEG